VQWSDSSRLPLDQLKLVIPEIPAIGFSVNSFCTYFMLGISSKEGEWGMFCPAFTCSVSKRGSKFEQKA
jgi:hypothetical protein